VRCEWRPAKLQKKRSDNRKGRVSGNRSKRELQQESEEERWIRRVPLLPQRPTKNMRAKREMVSVGGGRYCGSREWWTTGGWPGNLAPVLCDASVITHAGGSSVCLCCESVTLEHLSTAIGSPQTFCAKATKCLPFLI